MTVSYIFLFVVTLTTTFLATTLVKASRTSIPRIDNVTQSNSQFDEIDKVGARIDKQVNLMVDRIAKHGIDIDSPQAIKAIDDKGKDVDRLSDFMDNLVGEKGRKVSNERQGKNHLLQNETTQQSSNGRSLIDIQSEKVDRLGDLVEQIGNSIRKRNHIIRNPLQLPRGFYVKNSATSKKYQQKLKTVGKQKNLQKSKRYFFKESNDGEFSSNINKDEERSKVIVPVGQQKLNKLMVFYYMKKKFPEFVNIIEKELDSGNEEEPGENSNLSTSLEINKDQVSDRFIEKNEEKIKEIMADMMSDGLKNEEKTILNNPSSIVLPKDRSNEVVKYEEKIALNKTKNRKKGELLNTRDDLVYPPEEVNYIVKNFISLLKDVNLKKHTINKHVIKRQLDSNDQYTYPNDEEGGYESSVYENSNVDLSTRDETSDAKDLYSSLASNVDNSILTSKNDDNSVPTLNNDNPSILDSNELKYEINTEDQTTAKYKGMDNENISLPSKTSVADDKDTSIGNTQTHIHNEDTSVVNKVTTTVDRESLIDEEISEKLKTLSNAINKFEDLNKVEKANQKSTLKNHNETGSYDKHPNNHADLEFKLKNQFQLSNDKEERKIPLVLENISKNVQANHNLIKQLSGGNLSTNKLLPNNSSNRKLEIESIYRFRGYHHAKASEKISVVPVSSQQVISNGDGNKKYSSDQLNEDAFKSVMDAKNMGQAAKSNTSSPLTQPVKDMESSRTEQPVKDIQSSRNEQPVKNKESDQFSQLTKDVESRLPITNSIKAMESSFEVSKNENKPFNHVTHNDKESSDSTDDEPVELLPDDVPLVNSNEHFIELEDSNIRNLNIVPHEKSTEISSYSDDRYLKKRGFHSKRLLQIVRNKSIGKKNKTQPRPHPSTDIHTTMFRNSSDSPVTKRSVVNSNLKAPFQDPYSTLGSYKPLNTETDDSDGNTENIAIPYTDLDTYHGHIHPGLPHMEEQLYPLEEPEDDNNTKLSISESTPNENTRTYLAKITPDESFIEATDNSCESDFNQEEKCNHTNTRFAGFKHITPRPEKFEKLSESLSANKSINDGNVEVDNEADNVNQLVSSSSTIKVKESNETQDDLTKRSILNQLHRHYDNDDDENGGEVDQDDDQTDVDDAQTDADNVQSIDDENDYDTVSRLSYLTEKHGRDMSNNINDRILDVENIGKIIERKVANGIRRVSEVSDEVEAPEYDRHGSLYRDMFDNDGD